VSEWNLVNPLLYPVLPKKDEFGAQCNSFRDDKAFISSRNLVFVREDYPPGQYDKNEFEHLRSLFAELLGRLRHESGQADMPKPEDLVMVMFGEIESLPEPPALEPFGNVVTIQTYPLIAAVTERQYTAALKLPKDFTSPIHRILFLDAISAYLEHDFRVSILFAAMAMEIAFGTALEEAYEAILASPDNPRYRVQTIPIGGGAFSIKDPIFDRLREKTDFSIRVHEMSLYVLGKSLRVDKESLYKRALTLYRSRNKIVHLGTTDDAKEEVLVIDEKGAFAAVETASDCLSWLGLSSGAPLPKLAFVSGEEFSAFVDGLDV
jgi:hypothetical protein